VNETFDKSNFISFFDSCSKMSNIKEVVWVMIHLLTVEINPCLNAKMYARKVTP